MSKERAEATSLQKTESLPVTVNSADTMQKVFRHIFESDNIVTEIFPERVVVSIAKIKNINDKVHEKLKTNNVKDIITHVLVRLQNGKALEFKSIPDFLKYDWEISETIDYVQLEWKFLNNLNPEQDEKERLQVIGIYISSSFKPMHLFQALCSNDPYDYEKFEIKSFPMSCKSTCSNQIINTEVINLISEWNKSLPKPEPVIPILTYIKDRPRIIHYFIRLLFPMLIVAMFYSIYLYLSYDYKDMQTTPSSLIIKSIQWLCSFVLALFIGIKGANWITNYIIHKLDSFGIFPIFSITSGDIQRMSKAEAKSKKSLIRVITSSVLSILVEIAVGIFTCYLWTKYF